MVRRQNSKPCRPFLCVAFELQLPSPRICRASRNGWSEETQQLNIGCRIKEEAEPVCAKYDTEEHMESKSPSKTASASNLLTPTVILLRHLDLQIFVPYPSQTPLARGANLESLVRSSSFLATCQSSYNWFIGWVSTGRNVENPGASTIFQNFYGLRLPPKVFSYSLSRPALFSFSVYYTVPVSD